MLLSYKRFYWIHNWDVLVLIFILVFSLNEPRKENDICVIFLYLFVSDSYRSWASICSIMIIFRVLTFNGLICPTICETRNKYLRLSGRVWRWFLVWVFGIKKKTPLLICLARVENSEIQWQIVQKRGTIHRAL